MTGLMRLTAVAALAAVGLAACDSGGGFDQAAFCKIAREINDVEGAPSTEQLDEYVAAAPDDIEEDAEFVADKFEEAGNNIGAVFADPQIGEKIGRFEEAERRECGLHEDAEEGEIEGEGDTEASEGAAVVEVTGVEYAFQGVPQAVPAGLTALALTNGGEEAHQMVVFRLAEGRAAADILSLEGEDDPAAAEVIEEEVGSAFGEPGGETGYVNADLTPGSYALVCFIPGPGGKAHAELGMTADLTVA